MTVRLLLVRHGTVDFSSRRFRTTPRGRQWDPDLGNAGREQAARLAARLRLMDRPTAIFTSPFERCLQTIEPALRAAGVRPAVVEDLGEVFNGEWEGMSFEEIVSTDEELARRFREQDPMFVLAPGGESGAELRARVVPAVERAIEQAAEGTVVVVAHGGVINAYLGHVLGIERDLFFGPDNASINTVRADGDRRDVIFLNDVRHLTDPSIFAEPSASSALEAPKATDRYTSHDGAATGSRTTPNPS